MTLRPSDYDKYGDIIPDSVREDKGDLISRSALKEEIENLIGYSLSYEAILNAIDNAPTVEAVPLDFHEKCMDKTVRELLEVRTKGEIIKCKDCKYRIKEWREDKRMKEKGYWVYGCSHFGSLAGYWCFGGSDNEFCSDAERAKMKGGAK